MVASAENHSSQKQDLEKRSKYFTNGYFLFRFDPEHISDSLLFVFENHSALLRHFVSR
jgi:hypothetical protein